MTQLSSKGVHPRDVFLSELGITKTMSLGSCNPKRYAFELTEYTKQLIEQAITINSLEEGVTGPFSKLGLVTTYQYPHASAPDQEPKSLNSLNGVYSKRNVRRFHTKSVYCQFCDKEAVLRIRKHGDPNTAPPYLCCDNVEATPKI